MIKSTPQAGARQFLYWCLGIAGFFVLLWTALYLPLQRSLIKNRTELAWLRSQIEQVDLLMGREDSVGERVQKFRRRFEIYQSKLPAQEKDALKKLSQIAAGAGVAIASLQSQPRVEVLDEEGQPVEAAGRRCYSALVSLELRADYKKFTAFLDKLTDDMPYFTVHRFSMTREQGKPGPLLNINLEFKIYLIS